MWKRELLEEACTFISRGISPKYTEEGGVLVINQKCVRNHRIDYSLARRHDIEKKNVKPERFIQRGDILINSTGQGTLGRVAQVRDEPPEPTTVDSHVTIVRPNPEKFYLDYFGYALIQIEDELKNSGQGTSGQTELAKTRVQKEFFASYPSDKSEQQRIVAKLDAVFAEIDEAINKAEAKETEVQKLKTSLLSSSLNGDDLMWKTVKLGEIASWVRGLTYSKKDEVENGGIAVLRATNIDLATHKIVLDEIRYVSETVKVKGDKYAQLGDLLVCTASGSKSHVGKVAIVEEELGMAFGGFMAAIRCNEHCFPRFLYHVLTSQDFKWHLKSLGDGANINNLKFSQIENYELPLPPLAEQQRIVAKLDAANIEFRNANESIAKSKANYLALKSAILAQELQSKEAA